MASEQTVKKASNRGGRRPGAGRRPIAGKPLETMVVARLTAEQKALYKKVGGTTWLRAVLNAGLSLDEVPDVAPSSIKEKARLRELPLFESGVQAGFPSPAEDYERKDIDLNKVLISNARATCVMRVRGESMNAAGIDDHDLILVDRSKIARTGDIIIAQACCTDSNYALQFHLPGDFSPIGDFQLCRLAADAAEKFGYRYHVGNVFSTDAFYCEDDRKVNWTKMGVLADEMEAPALYMNAARAGKKALCICTVSDHLITGEATSAEERQTTFTKMMDVAFDVVTNLK